MALIEFSEWVKLREQAYGAAAGPIAGAAADAAKNQMTDMKIKKTIAGSLSKPEKVRKSALQNLAMQMANDPKSKPDDIKKVSDAMGSDENKPGQPQK